MAEYPTKPKDFLTMVVSIIAIIAAVASIAMSFAVNRERIESLGKEVSILRQETRNFQDLKTQTARIESEISFIRQSIQEIKVDVKELKKR